MSADTPAEVAAYFDRYARLFQRALAGEADVEDAAALYADAFVAAGPQGVMAGANDGRLREALAAGFAHYRQTGVAEMRLVAVGWQPIDAMHGVAPVDWRALYRRDGREVPVEFRVHYLVRLDPGGPRVFGWIAGDEQAELARHGLA